MPTAPRPLFVRFRAAALLLLALASILVLAASPAAHAQTMTATGFNGGSGANDFVFHVYVQTDGRILIGGRFTTYDGVTRSGIARLNADGSLDTSFNPGTGTVGSVYFVVELANGQILIAGDFTAYNGVAQSGIARLNADGTLDPTFAVGSGADGKAVFAFAGQVDGKLIVGGRFTTFNGTPRAGVVRLNPDGSVDNTFNPGSGTTGNSGNGTNGTYDVVVQPDGRILLAGFFNAYNGTQSPGVVRVNTDGSLDASFVVGNGVGRGNFAQTVSFLPNGQIIVGGNFIRFGNAAAPGIVRLNADGSIDATFNAGAGAAGRSDVIYAAIVQPDGKYVVGGDFATFNGVTTDGIVRLNTDGSVDNTFNTNGGVGGSYVYALAEQPDGSILLGGNFTTVGGFVSPGVARLDTNGMNESEDVVTISANLPKIGYGQATNTALVTFTRTGNLSQGLEVFYTFAGAAVSGVDYLTLSGHRTIKAGAASVSFSVVAIAPADPTYTVLPVKIVEIAGTGYTVGSVPPFVKIKIVH